MIHLINVDYASPELRALVTSERTMQEDEQLFTLFANVPERHIFSDNYGPACVLAQIGLSWLRDVVPLLNDDFVLTPYECGKLMELAWKSMPPEPTKVIFATGYGTELTFVSEKYPEAKVVRDHSQPYDAEEISTIMFKLGNLHGLLHNGQKGNGILVSP